MTRGKKTIKGSSGFNRKNTDDFLAKNQFKPGVVVTDSGLQILEIEAGSDDHPQAHNEVEVHQRISLIDGTPIDDTYKTGETVRFSLDQAISGYREGLLLMGVGGRSKLYLPPDLAWGKRGSGKRIGPNAALIIDTRLIRII
ncbi:MAG: FKBP-type peptidyl-prolyl cis-trans isomerase [Candidatus Marinimicrobia bacterium]|nr:FKBP-type peptidyl-prolyl cis-trans isomerase [Candidatus Neomarinimicrobiota bacterium]